MGQLELFCGNAGGWGPTLLGPQDARLRLLLMKDFDQMCGLGCGEMRED